MRALQQQQQLEADHDAEPAQAQQQQQQEQQQAVQDVEPDAATEQPEMGRDVAIAEDAEPVAAEPRTRKRKRKRQQHRPTSSAQRRRAKHIKERDVEPPAS